ncbi:SDR family NAD(P)-dependent oxidoreductase [Mesorhizobium sp. M1399]|uniref:SDR family NAD(P)-dependent oxidoreductase n=1 Tax=Mesorhizobium sp. M1399 TaxID=2957096 RepID=UPI003335DDC1
MYEGKIALITGGTGSFGNAVLKRLLSKGVQEVRIFSRDELKQEAMRISLRDERVKFYIGDVRNKESIQEAMKGVTFAFHAAALKQVPSCEFYPMEAVRTNILGAENVMDAAIFNGVEKLVLLSTDKAVYPINAMGLSKAMMEKLMIAKARVRGAGETVICGTRYGNVMASRGSVIPLFVEQILGKAPVTITDPEMTRFLMSLEESVDLVEYAFDQGKQGDIYVQKAPACTVRVLADALTDIFGSNSEVKIIGTRHGEKLYETLVSREERAKAEETSRYFRVPADNRGLNYNVFFTDGEKSISNSEDYTSHNAKRLNVQEVKGVLTGLDYIREKIDA